MLRWVGWSALLCLICAAFGLGKVMPLSPSYSGLFLAMAALSATVLVGSYEAYDAQPNRAPHAGDDEYGVR